MGNGTPCSRWSRHAGAALVACATLALPCGAPRAAASDRGLHVIPLGDHQELLDLALASDGTPWIATDGGTVFHVTADGHIARYRTPIANGPSSTTWVADGALWMIDDAIGGVARLSPEGRLTEYPWLWARNERELSTTNPPTSVMAGPDGTTWFGDRFHHRIISVTTAGASHVLVQVGRGSCAQPQLLLTAPDASVWFSDDYQAINDPLSSGGLCRLSPDGRLDPVRFPRGLFGSGAIAPNGDLWFNHSQVIERKTYVVQRDSFIRIDAHGRVTRFKVPIPEAWDITVAPDGAVWTGGFGVIARMHPSGRFTLIRRAPALGTIGPVRVAPDGRIWMLVDYDNRGRLGWLPPKPCLSRRRITVHLRSHRRDPIRSVRVRVQTVGGVYKLVADRPPGGSWRPVAKRSPDKATLPGPKQVFRHTRDGVMTADVLATADEQLDGRPLLVRAMSGGRLQLTDQLAALRVRAAAELAALPPELQRIEESPPAAAYPVTLSPALQRLTAEVQPATGASLLAAGVPQHGVT